MHRLFLVLLLLLPSLPAQATNDASMSKVRPVDLEFGGYKFGQNPAANMVCSSGYCKSQAPGGDGRISFPFSLYETPGAVSPLTGLTVVNPRYAFWEDRLFRVYFNVDCTPLDTEECLEDMTRVLDREYELLPLSSSDTTQFALDKRNIYRDFLTSEGALLRIRAIKNTDGWRMPSVDIVDKGMADQVGATLNPNFIPKKMPIPDNFGKK